MIIFLLFVAQFIFLVGIGSILCSNAKSMATLEEKRRMISILKEEAESILSATVEAETEKDGKKILRLTGNMNQLNRFLERIIE